MPLPHETPDPQIESFHDPRTGTVTHLLHSGRGTPCAVVDPVMGFDLASGVVDLSPVAEVVRRIRELDLAPTRWLETHVHADHLSATFCLRKRFGGRIGIGASVEEVSAHFGELFDLPRPRDVFDDFFREGDVIHLGALRIDVMEVEGHTPADVAYRVGSAVFVGDTLFAPAKGSARTDFPGGDASRLYRSVKRLLALPAETQLYLGHDYPSPGEAPVFCHTVGSQRANNVHFRAEMDEGKYVDSRRARDRTLDLPKLFWPAIQTNLAAGRLPDPDDDGACYFRTPIRAEDLVEFNP